MNDGNEPAAARFGRELSQVLQIRPFRRLWLVLALSSLGDWMGLLASAAFASAQLTTPSAKGAAFGGVIAVQLVPALVLGPAAGIVADRFDRRRVMAVADLARFALLASIPVAALVSDRPAVVIGWAGAAMFLVQVAGTVWAPAKEAAVPNLLPRARLETANQVSLFTTYGLAPVLAAVLLAALARLPSVEGLNADGLALLFDAVTFAVSAAVVFFGIPEISVRAAVAVSADLRRRAVGLLRDLAEGGRYVWGEPLVRGLLVGVLGAFAGAGVVIGTARFYAGSLGGGDATFALLFGFLFLGFGIGVTGGPVLVGGLSRRRWFASSIVLAAVAVAGLALAPRLSAAAAGAAAVGAGAGMAFLSGITLLGAEVPDRLRGRVFAFVQMMVRVTLLASVSVAGVAVGAGSDRFRVAGTGVSAARVLLLVAGCCGVVVGVVTLRQMDDRAGVPVRSDLWRAIRRRPLRSRPGLLVLLDGPAEVVAGQVGALVSGLGGRDRVLVPAGTGSDPAAVRDASAGGAIVLRTARRPGERRPDLWICYTHRGGHRDAGRVVLDDRRTATALARATRRAVLRRLRHSGRLDESPGPVHEG